MTVYSPRNAFCYYCEATKRWLNQAGVQFREVKTDKFNAFPKVQVGEQLISGYDTDAFARALGVKASVQHIDSRPPVYSVSYCRPCR